MIPCGIRIIYLLYFTVEIKQKSVINKEAKFIESGEFLKFIIKIFELGNRIC